MCLKYKHTLTIVERRLDGNIVKSVLKGESMKINKAEIIKEFGKDEKDTGSVEVQVALLTARIKNLTEHLKSNKQDKHSTRGLNKMVSQRKKLLDYLSSQDINRARSLKAKLGIRG